jgi:hypothetical protein
MMGGCSPTSLRTRISRIKTDQEWCCMLEAGKLLHWVKDHWRGT